MVIDSTRFSCNRINRKKVGLTEKKIPCEKVKKKVIFKSDSGIFFYALKIFFFFGRVHTVKIRFHLHFILNVVASSYDVYPKAKQRKKKQS